MKKINILWVILVIFGVVGSINFFLILVLRFDFCLFTWGPASEMTNFQMHFFGIATMLSLTLGVSCFDLEEEKSNKIKEKPGST